LRDNGKNEYVNNGVTDSILKQLDNLELRREYLRQEHQETTDEYAKITMSIGILDLCYVKWKSLMEEIKEK
jgi:hypothetical protein